MESLILTRQLIVWLEVSWLNRKPAENINNNRHNQIFHGTAFCIEIFDADIQIPETSLQALLPSFPLLRPHPRESLLAGYIAVWH